MNHDSRSLSAGEGPLCAGGRSGAEFATIASRSCGAKAKLGCDRILVNEFWLKHMTVMSIRVFAGVLGCFLAAGVAALGKETRATLIYDDVTTEVNPAQEEAGQLWITTADLERATRFEVKPQGVCRDQLCFPLPKARAQEFVRKGSGKSWFNMTAFAQLVQQPVAHDAALSTWYFGLRADQRQGLASLEAPDFSLPDMDGKIHSLYALRGKKVLLVTWASW